MKKAIFILALVIALTVSTGVTAFAHGGHGGGHGGHRAYRAATVQPQVQVQPQYVPCTAYGCDLAGLHHHNGAWYGSPTGVNGTYAACTVANCTLLGLHEHDGTYYYCANHTAGHGCVR